MMLHLWSTLLLSPLMWHYSTGVGLHKKDNDFCYVDPDCGPGSEHWGGECQDGFRQSPISIPALAPILSTTTSLDLHSYKSGSFRMQNNGHTVHIELLDGPDGPNKNFIDDSSPINLVLPFSDPFLKARYGREETAFYKFDTAHFHWGPTDKFGSEHCFDDRCFSMELHLVHHLSSYDSMEAALDSSDPNAMAVIAVMLDVTPAAGPGNPVLAPIVNNLFRIEEASHDDWTYVNGPLDFTPLLDTSKPSFVYTYKGSLTTPDCDEQVNWYVFKKPIAISHRDVQSFRFLLDNRGDPLRENHRPLQNRNGRAVHLSPIRSLC